MRNKRYIRFFGFVGPDTLHFGEKYGLRCTRSWWKCFKLGIKHVLKGNAVFFLIERRPKKSLHSH